MPSGGVDVDNVDKWIKAGAYAVGTGSSLTKGAKTGDFAAVTAKAQEFVKAVAAARLRQYLVPPGVNTPCTSTGIKSEMD